VVAVWRRDFIAFALGHDNFTIGNCDRTAQVTLDNVRLLSGNAIAPTATNDTATTNQASAIAALQCIWSKKFWVMQTLLRLGAIFMSDQPIALVYIWTYEGIQLELKKPHSHVSRLNPIRIN
jgi:hypothetical protein